jgi:hypothetical protein
LFALAGCSGGVALDHADRAPAAPAKSLRPSPQSRQHKDVALFSATTTETGDAPLPQLEYLGGPILQSVQVYTVYWGENVSDATVRALPDYYRAILGDGPFMQMLSEYDTTSPAQVIGHGTFAGEIVDADAPIPPAGTLLTDLQIRAELSRLIDLGQLPSENAQNLFMIYFPPGVNIINPNNEVSCVQFCAYHNAFQRNGDDPTSTLHNVYYGVLPDFSNKGCEAHPGTQPSFCGFDPDNLTNLEVVSSHEMVEAITDAAIGIPAPGPIGSPLAWNDPVFDEIGDICEFFPDGATNGVNVQLFWSNEDRACRDHRPTANLLLEASPATQTVPAGGVATFNIRLSPPAQGAVNQDPVTFAIRDAAPPVGTLLPASFAPAAITVGQSTIATLPIAPDAPSGVKRVLVSGIDSNGLVHYAAAKIQVTTAPPVISDVSPHVGASVGGTPVTLRGERLSPALKAQIVANGVSVPALVKTTKDAKTHAVTATVTTPGFAISAGQERARVQIVLTNPDGNTASADFTYERSCDDDRPRITIVDTPSGPIAGGTIVGVQGLRFGASARDANGNFAEPTVLFGGQKAQIIDIDPKNSNSLVVMTPPVSAATVVDVVVVNADGQASQPFASFAYGPDVPPQLDKKRPLSIDHGPSGGGTYVTLFADVASAPFDAGATVTFGGQPATVKTINDSFAGVIAPPHTAGVVDVVITNSDGEQATARRAFRYAH